ESHPERVEEERTRELGRSVRAVAVALAPEPALLEKARGRRAEALGGAHGPTCGVVTRSAGVVEQARLPVLEEAEALEEGRGNRARGTASPDDVDRSLLQRDHPVDVGHARIARIQRVEQRSREELVRAVARRARLDGRRPERDLAPPVEVPARRARAVRERDREDGRARDRFRRPPPSASRWSLSLRERDDRGGAGVDRERRAAGEARERQVEQPLRHEDRAREEEVRGRKPGDEEEPDE